MKKKYITPATTEIEISQNEVICTSNLYYGGEGDGIPAEAPIVRGTGWSDYEGR